MAKPEWGIKRVCTSCKTRFYDLKNNPIICPSCGVTVDPDAVNNPKRGRAASAKEAPTKAKEVAEDDDVIDLEAVEVPDIPDSVTDDGLLDDDDDESETLEGFTEIDPREPKDDL